MHLGNAIMSFYAALIDLLGRCAPEMHVGSGATAGLGASPGVSPSPEAPPTCPPLLSSCS